MILFGSYARGDWVEDHDTLYFSDYDVLIVVDKPEVAHDLSLWSRLTDQAKAIAQGIPVSLFVHDIKQINEEIRRGRYFYTDVLREGIELYNSRRFMLAKPKAKTPAERLDIARYDFRYWFQSASGFWDGVAYYEGRRDLAHAAFLLHQAAERFYHAVLLVFTGYKPRTHNLEELANKTADLHEALRDAMPRSEAEDEHLFDLLKRAYIEARYSKSYAITVAELNELRERVRDLAVRVRKACGDQLGTFVTPEAVGPLPDPPDYRDPYELPPPPPLDNPQAVHEWQERVAWFSEARGRAEGLREGHEEGLREGEERGEVRGLARGREEGRSLGLAESKAADVVAVLEARGLTVTDEQRDRIRSTTDLETLDRWVRRAATIDSTDRLFE